MALPRVLFLCVGNSVRSQMAEGFARAYGSDVLVAASAGVAPAGWIAPSTIKIMKERNIDIEHAFSKGMDEAAKSGPFDLIVNISGRKLPFAVTAPVEEWAVHDPIGEKESAFREVAGEIESRVMRLVLSMRQQKAGALALHRPL